MSVCLCVDVLNTSCVRCTRALWMLHARSRLLTPSIFTMLSNDSLCVNQI